MALKIRPEHYDVLERACNVVVSQNPTSYEQYRTAGLSDMRYNFDVLRACRVDGKSGTEWICEQLYPYLNDEHIGSALAKILGNTGKNTKGKR